MDSCAEIKSAPVAARFVTNEVVTNLADIAPLFSHLDIIHVTLCLSLMCVCVHMCACVRACVRACVHQTEREKRERQRGRERQRETERDLID